MAPGGIKARRKQALVVPPGTGVTTRFRNSLKTKEVPRDGPADGSPGNCDKGTSPLHASGGLANVANSIDGIPQGHGDSQVASGGDVGGIALGHADSQVPSGGDGDGIAQGHGDSQVASGGDRDGIAQADGDNQVDRGGDGNVEEEDVAAMDMDCEVEEPWIRGINKGAQLQRMSRARRGKLSVVIKEGYIRPLNPVVASKFATQCNIIVRSYIPVLPKWKDYKEPSAASIHKLFRMHIAAKFDINIKDKHIQYACAQMMKNAVRQHRCRLKEKHFNPFPLHLVTKTSPDPGTNDKQWGELVKSWSSEKKMENCELNKNNRSMVRYHHTTGSRSYTVHLENLRDKYKEKQADAVDMFKECHYSKKKDYTPDVQLLVDELENKVAGQEEDEDTPCVTEVVAAVLAEKTKKPTFLHNVGLQRKKKGTLKEQLAAEKLAKDDLKWKVEELAKKLQESEQARVMEQQEMARKQAETNAKLDPLLSKIGDA